MALLNSKMVIKQTAYHANMTELNHLGAALIAKPTVLEGKMNTLFTSLLYSENTLTSMLVGKSEKTIDSTSWEWGMKGGSDRPLVIVENVEPASNTQLGRFKQLFKIKLDLDWYLPGDVISPGDVRYQVRIQTQPSKHGNGYIYQVQLMDGDPAAFLPLQFVTAGSQWGKLYSQYEEAAEQSGSTQYSLPIAMKNTMSRYRKHYRVTGDAANEVLAVAIPDSKGNMHKSWIKYAEVEYWAQWYKELERGYWYSKFNDTVLGANGRPIYTGPGVHEMIEEDGHVHRYSHLSTTLIEEFLMDIFYSRVAPGKNREIVGFTGEYGMMQFHRAINDWMERKKGIAAILDTNYIQKDKSPYNDNALVAGYQYTKFRMPNGAVLSLVHNPLYDDRTINFAIDPVTGFPKESQRITFLDFSGKGAESNITLMNKTNIFKLGYVHGLQTPYGPVNKGAMAHSGDYYEMHVQKQSGIHIEDVTKCGMLILDRD
jgi:hypothetical protein